MVNERDEVVLYRVLEVHPDLEIACIFNCTQPPSNSSAYPERISLTKIEAMISSGLAVLLEAEDDPFRPAGKTGLTPLQAAACERNYTIIQQIVEDYSVLALTDRNTRGLAVRGACQQYRDGKGKLRLRSHKTVSVMLRSWWRGGMVQTALVPNYRARGSKGIKEGNRKPGRKPRHLEQRPEWSGVSLSPADILRLQDGFERFRIKKRLPLDLAYSRTIMTYWPVITQRPDNTLQCALPSIGTAPSFHQWYYHGQKLLKDKNLERRDQRLRRLHGDQTFDNNMRPERLSVSRLSEGPGWLCQYDATPFPITLVREDDRSKIIGRPLMFTLTDILQFRFPG